MQDCGVLEKGRQSLPAGSRNGSEEKAALAEPGSVSVCGNRAEKGDVGQNLQKHISSPGTGGSGVKDPPRGWWEMALGRRPGTTAWRILNQNEGFICFMKQWELLQ